jgi:CRISPR-associated protein Cmr1
VRVTEIEATYRVVTPCFCGGAEQQAEFRLPSFKGVLRFWWRALAWRRWRGDLSAIDHQEVCLFGGAGVGQSKVVLHAATDRRPSVQPVGTVLSMDGRDPIGEGARYLGYGVMHAFDSAKSGVSAAELIRECLMPPLAVTIRLRCRGLDVGQHSSLVDALEAVGLFGGIGARSRRGYGSLSLRTLTVNGEERWREPGSLAAFRAEACRFLVGAGSAHLPEFTAFSPRGRHVLLTSQHTDAMGLLNLVGSELVRFRSSGRNGRILGGREPAERRFKGDHLLVVQGGRVKAHPRRVAFGLPLNFGKLRHLQVGPADSLNRRASPLLIHLHEGASGPIAVVSLLPARFLPGSRPQILVGGTPVAQQAESTLYQPVHEFLDRLLDPAQRRGAFSESAEVTP